MGIAEDIKKHNKKVKEEFEKAEKGKTINLTDLMISKEKIEEKLTPIHILKKMKVSYALCKYCGRSYPLRFLKEHQKECKIKKESKKKLFEFDFGL